MNRYWTRVAQDVAVKASLCRMKTRMRRECLVETSGLPFFRDDRTNANVLRHQRGKRASRICDRLLPGVCNPVFGRGAFHLFGHMETEALGITEDLDHFVGNDFRPGKRAAYHDARSPAGMNADSERPFHVGVPLDAVCHAEGVTDST